MTDYLQEMILYFRIHHHHECFYCGLKGSRRRHSHRIQLTRDHVIPLSLGGEQGNINVVPACLPCNRAKDNMPIEEFRNLRYGGRPIEFFGETMFRLYLAVLKETIERTNSSGVSPELPRD